MHGDVAYCKKHGHDFKVRGVDIGHDGIEYWHRECQICGMNQVIGVWFREEVDE